MTDERISEVETKLYTHEGRIKSTEQNIRQITDNIDRIESHLLRGSSKPLPVSTIVSIIVGFLGAFGTTFFAMTNYVDLQVDNLRESDRANEERIIENHSHIKEFNSEIRERLGRLEERSKSHEEDIRELRK
jgi:peptidoglycan hydrolase CwlO-like protein